MSQREHEVILNGIKDLKNGKSRAASVKLSNCYALRSQHERAINFPLNSFSALKR